LVTNTVGIEPSTWIKIPCDEQFDNALVLCNAIQQPEPDPIDKLDAFNSDEYCPTSWVPLAILSRFNCVRLINAIVDLDARELCDQAGGRVLQLEDPVAFAGTPPLL
jgi:hypothetical protein